ncbi:MAG TPA: CsbD family protein [Pyrinomonadaceae bacterium]
MRYEGELKGKGKQVKGAAKQQLGRLLDDPALHDEGSADRVEGKVQEKASKARRVIGETVEDIGEKIAGGS